MATTEQDIRELLKANPPAKKFVPYCFISAESDSLTVYFEGDADYSVRLNEHLTVYRSLETKEIVGCRVKGISSILEDLPNFIRVKGQDGNIELSLLFFAFRGKPENEEERETVTHLAKAASERNISLDRSAL